MTLLNEIPSHRVCSKCNSLKEMNEFTKAKNGKYGRSARCRSCAAAYNKENQKRISQLSLARYHRINEPKKLAKEQKKIVAIARAVEGITKICCTCKSEKPKADFAKSSRNIDGLRRRCKECHNAANKKYRELNPDKSAASSRNWVKRNRDKVAAKKARWEKNNPGRLKELIKTWSLQNPGKIKAAQRRRLLKKGVRLHRAMSERIRRMVFNKPAKTFDLLPYSRDELITHLEKQFQPGMCWSNYGKWHIDHIVPLASFSIYSVEDIDFKYVWSLANLRPLWAKENMAKGAKKTFLI